MFKEIKLSTLTVRQAGALAAIENIHGSRDEVPTVSFSSNFEKLKKQTGLKPKALKAVFKQLLDLGYLSVNRHKGTRGGAVYWKGIDGEVQPAGYPSFDTGLPTETLELDADLLGLFIYLRDISRTTSFMLYGSNAELKKKILGCPIHFLRVGIGALIDLGYLTMLHPGGFSRGRRYQEREIRVEELLTPYKNPEKETRHGRKCPCKICTMWFRSGYTLKVVDEKKDGGPTNILTPTKDTLKSKTIKTKNTYKPRVRIFTSPQRTQAFTRIHRTIQQWILLQPQWSPILNDFKTRPTAKIECTRTDYLVAKICFMFNIKQVVTGNWERFKVKVGKFMASGVKGQDFQLKLALYYFEHGYLTPSQISKGFASIGERWEIVSQGDQDYSTSTRSKGDGIFRLPKRAFSKTAVDDDNGRHGFGDPAKERLSEIPSQLGHYPEPFRRIGTLDKALVVENLVRQAEGLDPLGNQKRRTVSLGAFEAIQAMRPSGPDKAAGRFLVRAFVKYCRGKDVGAPAGFSKKYGLFDSILEFYLEHGYVSSKQRLCVTLMYLEIRMLSSRAVKALERLRAHGNWFQRFHQETAPNALTRFIQERFGYGQDSADFFEGSYGNA